MNDLKTGDILLFSGHITGWLKYFTDMIRYTTHCNYSHVGFVIKDPTFIDPSLKGIYVWESGWEGKKDPQDGEIKLGVQLTPLDEIMENFKGSKIIKRSFTGVGNYFTDEKLKAIHKVVHDKPYDVFPKHWVEALFRKDDDPQRISSFWCSALVGYIFVKCGIIKPETDWSILRPSDFSIGGERLDYSSDYKLSNDADRIS